VNPIIKVRDVPPRTAFLLEQAGVHPLLARLFAARGVRSSDDLDDQPARLLPPDGLHGAAAAGVLLADAIEQGQRICVVADYDCDGATACATALRGLALLGAPPGALNYVVPDRQVHGYGLTPAIVDMAQAHRPDVLVTVDNGIASHEGVAHARALGLKVLVTDHHLPAMRDGQPTLPPANVIVNPNQPGCGFNSKAIAGVGVMFYTLLATRAELRRRGRWDAASQPRLDALLDLVALGTVADVVRLDANNRRLVAQGLKRIRAGRMQPGVAALYHAAARDATRASAFDFGFALGPRINAAGRLSDMTLGIECLLTDDAGRAAELAGQLDAINRERREVEAGMREQAELLLDAPGMPDGEAPARAGAVRPRVPRGRGRHRRRAHEGPPAPSDLRLRARADGLLKGSGRSIAGFHLRDALDLVSKRHPGLLRRFGGHAMAAGATLDPDSVDTFARRCSRWHASGWNAATLLRTVPPTARCRSSGSTPTPCRALDAQVWGQGFEAPVFCDEVEVLQQRLVADKHLKLRVRLAWARASLAREAIWFGHTEPLARPGAPGLPPEPGRVPGPAAASDGGGSRRGRLIDQPGPERRNRGPIDPIWRHQVVAPLSAHRPFAHHLQFASREFGLGQHAGHQRDAHALCGRDRQHREQLVAGPGQRARRVHSHRFEPLPPGFGARALLQQWQLRHILRRPAASAVQQHRAGQRQHLFRHQQSRARAGPMRHLLRGARVQCRVVFGFGKHERARLGVHVHRDVRMLARQ
jgi:single-stranded-DNA-specific exonuclease